MLLERVDVNPNAADKDGYAPLPDTLNKVSPPESSTPPTENVRPQRTERVKYQYAINAKRPMAKVYLPARKSTRSGSGEVVSSWVSLSDICSR